MDVPGLLRAARDRRGWSQSRLGSAAGLSRGNVSDYETGRTSPTVATLTRILAAAGLQVRAELEPLRADLDARVDAVVAGGGELDAGAVGHVSSALSVEGFAWGLDGETALRAQGLGFESDRVHVAIHFDDAARTYFFRSRVRGTGGDPVSWFEADLAAVQAYLGSLAFGPFGMVAVRVLAEPPTTLRVEIAPGLVVPVLTVDEVERGRPDLAEVLARLRARSLEA